MASVANALIEALHAPEIPVRDAAPRTKRESQEKDAAPGLRRDPDSAMTAQTFADKANAALQKVDQSLRFSIHEGTKTIVVRLVNDDTGEVIREIPQTKFLDLVATLEKLVGFVIDRKA